MLERVWRVVGEGLEDFGRGCEGLWERVWRYLVSGIWLTRPRLRHSRRGSLKMWDTQPPHGGLLGPARVGRSGRPMPAPCATRG